MRESNTGRRSLSAMLIGMTCALLAGSASAEGKEEVVGDPNLPWLDNAWYKVHLNVRARISLADIGGLENSEAYTIRSRAGLEAKPFFGFSAFAELENTWAIADDQYNDGTGSSNPEKSLIADPSNTEMNQAWLQYEHKDLFGQPILGAPMGAKAKAGRQRIIFDDARFIGNVGWRQNEQTYDAFLGQSNFGVDGLTVQYAYLWYIKRIFGDQSPASRRDFDSKSSLVRTHYKMENHEFTGFIYLLDFDDDSPGNSSNTYGGRAKGSFPITEEFSIGYLASYALQTDAADNPVDYTAHYVWAGLDAKMKGIGRLGVAFELLGSDDGDARFVTPLSTAHKFNGFADAFLNNGGNNGLRDLNITLAPALPWKIKGKIVYHEFWNDEGNDHLGREIDYVFSRPINKWMSVLTKGAYFMGKQRGPNDRWRFTFQLDFKY